MAMVHESAKEIPVKGEYDVIVAGAGPAGVGAAIAAGRMGVKTLLVERDGMVGGVATSGLMSHWTGATRGGIYDEILDRSVAAFPDTGVEDIRRWRQTIHTESLRYVLTEMLLEAGVQIRMHTQIAAPIMEKEKVVGLFTESKGGREAFLGKVTVDATGDGDVAAWAGAPFDKGRDSDSRMQPMTLMFKIGGVDMQKAIFPPGFESYVQVPKGEIQALAREHLPHPAGHVLLYRNIFPGSASVNMTNVIEVDGTNADDVTKAEIVCLQQVPKIVAFLKKYAPGYEKCYVTAMAARIGVRETRHFKGEYVLTADDIQTAKQFPNWIATCCHFNFDIHNLDGAGLDKDGEQTRFTQRKTYTIPYGCLLPLGVENVLLSGRMIAGTHKAHSNFRVMPICVHTGQAAGVAAALAVQKNIAPRKVSVSDIQAVLSKQGMLPPEE